jgi:hypothetical protein
VLAVAGCAGGSNDAGGGLPARSSGAGGLPAADGDEAAVAPATGQDLKAVDGRDGNPLISTRLPREHSIIQRAALTVRTRHVAEALAKAQAVVDASGGFVADERTEADKRGNARFSTLTVRVPEDEFDSVLSDLGALGTLEQQTRSAQDVTAEVVDVDSRVASAQASIKRIRLLLGRAQDLGDVISLESELSTRQADLEALEAQRAFYADQTAFATINLTLVAAGRASPPSPDEDDAGFLAGLQAGWQALVGFLTGLATGLGAVLPFALLAALVGVPVWLLVKSGRQRRVAAAPAPGGSAAAGE